MGCICCPLGSFISSLFYAIERVSTCMACTALVGCILFTVVVACVFGIALGYHFCLVEQNAEAMDKASLRTTEVGGTDLEESRAAGLEPSPALTRRTGDTNPEPLPYEEHRDSGPRPDSRKAGDLDTVDRQRAAANGPPDAMKLQPYAEFRALMKRTKREALDGILKNDADDEKYGFDGLKFGNAAKPIEIALNTTRENVVKSAPKGLLIYLVQKLMNITQVAQSTSGNTAAAEVLSRVGM